MVDISDVRNLSTENTSPLEQIEASDLQLLIDMTVENMPPQRQAVYKLSRVILEYNNKLRKTKMQILKGCPLYFRIKRLFHGVNAHSHLRGKAPQDIAAGLNLALRKDASSPTGHLSQYCCPDPAIVEWFDASLFEESADYEFEGCLFKGPKDGDKVLKAWFGDYMQLPPESKRKCKSRRYLRFYWKESLT